MNSNQFDISSVDFLLDCFRRALCAIAPLADEVGVPWREPDNYDDWDSIAIALFESFVSNTIQSRPDWENIEPIIKYDKRITDYCGCSYIAIEVNSKLMPFVCFETANSPFDMCLVVELDEGLKKKNYVKIPYASSNFVVLKKIKEGIKGC